MLESRAAAPALDHCRIGRIGGAMALRTFSSRSAAAPTELARRERAYPSDRPRRAGDVHASQMPLHAR